MKGKYCLTSPGSTGEEGEKSSRVWEMPPDKPASCPLAMVGLNHPTVAWDGLPVGLPFTFLIFLLYLENLTDGTFLLPTFPTCLCYPS